MSKSYIMADKHSISISDKLYGELKEYCELNNLKLNIFVEGLVQSAFNVERYGSAPFALEKELAPPPKKETTQPVDDYLKVLEKAKEFDKVIDGMREADKQMEEIVDSIPNIQEVRDAIDELVINEEPKPVDEPVKKKKKIKLN